MKLMNLKGTNDFLPKDQIIRNKIIDILKKKGVEVEGIV